MERRQRQMLAASRSLFQVVGCSGVLFSRRRQASVEHPAIYAIRKFEINLPRRHAKTASLSRKTAAMAWQTDGAGDREANSK